MTPRQIYAMKNIPFEPFDETRRMWEMERQLRVFLEENQYSRDVCNSDIDLEDVIKAGRVEISVKAVHEFTDALYGIYVLNFDGKAIGVMSRVNMREEKVEDDVQIGITDPAAFRSLVKHVESFSQAPDWVEEDSVGSDDELDWLSRDNGLFVDPESASGFTRDDRYFYKFMSEVHKHMKIDYAHDSRATFDMDAMSSNLTRAAAYPGFVDFSIFHVGANCCDIVSRTLADSPLAKAVFAESIRAVEDAGGEVPSGVRDLVEADWDAESLKEVLANWNGRAGMKRPEYRAFIQAAIDAWDADTDPRDLEDLNLAGMMKGTVAAELGKAGLGRLAWCIGYKAELSGGLVLKAPRFFPSTKRCGACGHVIDELGPVRSWVCPSCKIHHDRDGNAADNLCLLAKLASGDGPIPESLSEWLWRVDEARAAVSEWRLRREESLGFRFGEGFDDPAVSVGSRVGDADFSLGRATSELTRGEMSDRGPVRWPSDAVVEPRTTMEDSSGA